MSEYGIQFADWCEFPPETMVGETVFDGEGNAIGWIVNATAATHDMKKKNECQYCRRTDDRKFVRMMNEEAWVNVEYRTLDVAVCGHEGSVPITHCPWCGREL